MSLRIFYLWFFFDCFISDSSAFSKSSLYIWNFSVHVLLKPSLKDFEHAHIQGRRRSSSKMVGGAQLSLKSNPTPSRVAFSAQTKPCVHQNPGKGECTPQETEPDLPVTVLPLSNVYSLLRSLVTLIKE